MSRWGTAGPPEDAYSRVTDPERFAPLHSVALNRLVDLSAHFYVTLRDDPGIDPELEKVAVVRPTVALIPVTPTAAPLVVAFTAFPGLLVRFGQWLIQPFPACGCDACDETLEGEVERFSWNVTQLISGRFRESIDSKFGGRFYRTHKFWSPDGSKSGGETLIEEPTPEIRAAEDVSREWVAWPRKPLYNI